MFRLLTGSCLFLCLSLAASAQLAVDFTADKAGGCSPLVIQFNASVSGPAAGASFVWDLGNGNTATTAAPQAIYTTVGTYTVSLTVVANGGKATATHTVTVYAPPIVDFTASDKLVCGTPVTFWSTSVANGGAGSAGDITGWLWDFEDGTTQQGTGIASHLFAKGLGSVSLTVTDVHGCTAVGKQENIVKTLDPLNVDFSPDKTVVCGIGDAVQFSNGSSGPGTLSYSWDFGDGTTTAQAAPSHVYAQSGIYTVKLTATSSVGCTVTNTRTNLLNVDDYHIDLQAPATVCANTGANVFDNSNPTPSSRVWTVNGINQGSGISPNYAFASAGLYTVSLTDRFGNCPLSATKTIRVNAPPPYTPFSVGYPPCGPPGTVTFADNTPGAVGWSWIFNGGSPSTVQGTATPSATFSAGSFTVQLTVTNAAGCFIQESQNINLYAPVIDIGETDNNNITSCNGPLTKSYAVLYGSVQTYDWDFGDGTHSSAARPTHTFTAPGVYTIVLHYTTAAGCTGVSNARQVTISPPISVDFSTNPTTVCTNAEVYFTNNIAASGATGYSFDFGDGYTSNNTVVHHYGMPGTYSVKLTAWNAGGCVATVSKPGYITVVGPSATYAGHTLSCANTGGDVTFSYPSTNITSFTWNFGDGTATTTDGSVTQQNHRYGQSGVYYPTVTATTGQCSVQFRDEVPVMIKQPAVLTGLAASVCSDGTLKVQIAAQRNPWPTLADPDFDYSYQFQYADGTPFLGAMWHTNLGGLYGNGTYNWTLSGFKPGETGLKVVMTAAQFGCTQVTNTIPLTIISGSATPAITVVSDNHCYQAPVQLRDASVAGAGNSIVGGSWDFGDGQTQPLVPGGAVSHFYGNPGQYSVRLTAQVASGCGMVSTPAVATVNVDGPKAAFSSSPAIVLLGNTVYFYNNTNEYGGTNISYTWDFGDGTGSTAFSPSHLYAQPGIYRVVLTAKDGSGGCSSTAAATIIVKYFNSHFQISPMYVAGGQCPPMLAQFTNTSVNYSSVAWDFGDGTKAGNLNYPSHVYPRPGAYEVTLYVYGSGGLTGQYTDSVFVRQPSGSLSAVKPAVCVGQPEQLQAKGKGALSFLFDFGDGSVTSSIDSNISHVYTASGNYMTRLVVVDTVGCPAAADPGVALLVNPLPKPTIQPADAHVCLGSGVVLHASGGSRYSWSPATGLDNPGIADVLASPAVNTNYSVMVTDDNGCQAQANTALTVVRPETLSVSPDSTALCAGESVTLHARGTDRYQWIGDTRGLNSTQGNNPVAQPQQTTHYRVVGSDAWSCFSDTAAITVTVLPLPTVNAGGNVAVLAGTPVTLAATGSDDIVSWRWTPADWLSCTDCSQPVCTPRRPETYIATVTNGVGCHARDTVQVKLLCVEAHVRIPEAFTPNGDGHNDRFTILGIGEVDHLVIYNRWGVKVFERDHFYTADAAAQWDGTLHGQPAPTGVYAYFVEMSCPSGGVFTRKGTVVLIR